MAASSRVSGVIRSETGAEGESDGRMRPLVRGHQRLHALEFTGAHDWGREFRHRNDEILYVADGSAEVEADGNFYRLEQGDTLYCAGGLVHRWRPVEPNTRVLVFGIADHVQATDEQVGRRTGRPTGGSADRRVRPVREAASMGSVPVR